MSKNNIKFTSANVDGDFYDELENTAKNFNMHIDNIYKDLIAITKQNIHCEHVLGLLTEYQNHRPERWETVYYSLDTNEIEIYGKLRQKYKISISKLAFIGFVLFWDLLMYIYQERLKKQGAEELLFSYRKTREKFVKLVPIFIKRLEIQKKQ